MSTKSVSNSKRVSAKRSVKIDTIADFRKVAADFGVECPTGRGRPPVKRLAAVLAEQNVTVTGDYDMTVKAPQPRENSNKGTAKWTVTATLPQWTKAGGYKRAKDGSLVSSGKAKSVTLTVAEIRELTNAVPSGRLSNDNIVKAGLIRLMDDRYDATVAAEVEATAVKAAESAATATAEPAKSDDTNAVDLDAQTDAEPVVEATEEVAA